MPLKTCLNCDNEFKPRKSTNKFCNNDCYLQYKNKQNPLVTIQCKNQECLKPVSTRKTRTGEYQKVFCSKSCAATHNNKQFPKRMVSGRCVICGQHVEGINTLCDTHAKELNVNAHRKLHNKKCKHCGNKFTTPHSVSKYCSVKCRKENFKLNNITDPSGRDNCKRCGAGKCTNADLCQTCQRKDTRTKRIAEWLAGNTEVAGNQYLSRTIRKYLLEEANYSCSKCGFNTPHPDDGSTILEINHIDGDGTNHSRSNLEVLCPNCHALTTNYRARNIGNGREQYYLRIEKG